MKRVILLTVLALAAAACASSTPTGSGSPSAPAENGDGEAGDFLALAKQGGSTEDFKLTFDATTNGETTTITWARRGDQASFMIGSGGDSTLVIEPGDGSTISCSGGQCFKIENEGGSGGLADAFIAPFQAFNDFVLNSSDLPGFSAKGGRTIAGREATCASWSYLGASTEVCVDNETGMTLRWSTGVDGEGLTWEVTEIGEPTDADFEPTGPVQNFGSMSGTGG